MIEYIRPFKVPDAPHDLVNKWISENDPNRAPWQGTKISFSSLSVLLAFKKHFDL